MTREQILADIKQALAIIQTMAKYLPAPIGTLANLLAVVLSNDTMLNELLNLLHVAQQQQTFATMQSQTVADRITA